LAKGNNSDVSATGLYAG